MSELHSTQYLNLLPAGILNQIGDFVAFDQYAAVENYRLQVVEVPEALDRQVENHWGHICSLAFLSQA